MTNPAFLQFTSSLIFCRNHNHSIPWVLHMWHQHELLYSDIQSRSIGLMHIKIAPHNSLLGVYQRWRPLLKATSAAAAGKLKTCNHPLQASNVAIHCILLSKWCKPKFCQWNCVDENFIDGHLTAQVLKITPLEICTWMIMLGWLPAWV